MPNGLFSWRKQPVTVSDTLSMEVTTEMKGEPGKTHVHAYEALLSLYPDHFWAVDNLANYFSGSGQATTGFNLLVTACGHTPQQLRIHKWGNLSAAS